MTTGKSTTASLGLIALIVFIDTAGIGLIIPVLPTLIGKLGHANIDRAAEIGGWLLFAYAIMQFTFAPIIGGLSDRYGRRPVLLVTLALLGIDYGLMAWAPTLVWLFVGRMISGIMGATWPAANSCVADTCAPEDRGRAFGLLGACGAAGFVLGPAIGGFFGQFGDRIPFLFACLLCVIGAALGFFKLRETLPREKRRAFTLARANPLGNIIQMMKTPLVIGLLVVIFFMQLGSQSQLSVWAYYGALKFNWSPIVIGLTVTLFGALLALVQGGLVGPVIKRLGEVRTAQFSLLFGIPSYLILAFATQTWHMIAGIIVGCVTGLTFPAMQSMMTRKVSEDAQGELQGAIASMISLTSIIGPLMMTSVFGAYADKTGLYFPGAPFILAIGLLLVAIAVLWHTLKHHAGVQSVPLQTSSPV
jgi:MFS transporter, DHA1 family, tetracycline resistance protein